MFKKSILITIALAVVLTAATVGSIDGRKLSGTGHREHAAICNAVIASNTLKRQRADRFIDSEQYEIRIRAILKRLQKNGIRVR